MLRLIAATTVIVSLSGAVVYFARENAALKQRLSQAVIAAHIGSLACVLPSAQATTLSGKQFTLVFPRDRPLLVLSTDKNCVFCQSALKQWPRLIAKFPELDNIIVDPKGSYTPEDLALSATETESVIRLVTPQSPYQELLKSTPTIMLVGKAGQVIGLWRGELTGSQVSGIESAIGALLM